MIISLLHYLSTLAVFAVVGLPLAALADKTNAGTPVIVVGGLVVITAGVWWWAFGFELLVDAILDRKRGKAIRREGNPRIPPPHPQGEVRTQMANPHRSNTWLARQVDEVSQGLLAGASRCLTHLKTELPADKKPDLVKEWEVVAEYMFFLLHICDRVAFGALRLTDRDAFMGQLAQLTLKRYSEAFASAMGRAGDAEELQKEVLRAAMDRHSEYGRYKSEPGEGGGLRGTLLWEFGKRIAQAVGLHPLDASVNYTAVTLAMAVLKALDLEKRLTPSI